MSQFKPSQSSLLVCTALVLLAHGLALHSIPLALHDVLQPANPADFLPPVDVTFVTRTTEPAPRPVATPPPTPSPTTTAKTEKTAKKFTIPLEEAPPPPLPLLNEREIQEQKPAVAQAEYAENAPKNIAEPVKPEPAKNTNELPAAWNYRPPPSLVLDYEVESMVDGTARTGAGELQWSHDGSTYSTRLSVSYFRITLRTQTSTGKIGAKGLEPRRFGDKTRSEIAAHFEREKGKISFSANTPDAPLQEGAQDQLSVILQLGALLSGNPDRVNEGMALPFQAVGARSAENWTFIVGKMERLNLPGGEIMARHLWREANAQYDVNVDVWLAPDLGYLPARIRLTQTNGNIIDQRWRSTEKP